MTAGVAMPAAPHWGPQDKAAAPALGAPGQGCPCRAGHVTPTDQARGHAGHPPSRASPASARGKSHA